MNNSNINTRLSQLIDYLGISNNEFARRIGISSARISKIISGGSVPRADLLLTIVSTFPDLSPEWLLKGEGPIFVSGEKIAKEGLVGYDGKNIRPVVATVSPTGDENIVLVEQKAAAGYLAGYQDPEYIEKLPAFNLPGYRGRTYRAFEVQGDSMWPSLHAGDYVVCEYIENWLHVRDGFCYVVVAEEGVLVKRAINRLEKKQYLILKSDNHRYPNIKLQGHEIQEIWHCKLRITPQFGSPYLDIYSRMDSLEERLDEIIKSKKTDK